MSRPVSGEQSVRRFAVAGATAILVVVAIFSVCGLFYQGLVLGLMSSLPGALIGGLSYWLFKRIPIPQWAVGLSSAIVSIALSLLIAYFLAEAVRPKPDGRGYITASDLLMLGTPITAIMAAIFGAGVGQWRGECR